MKPKGYVHVLYGKLLDNDDCRCGDGPSGKGVFIMLAVLMITIGSLVLSLGVTGLLRPTKFEEEATTPANVILTQSASTERPI